MGDSRLRFRRQSVSRGAKCFANVGDVSRSLPPASSGICTIQYNHSPEELQKQCATPVFFRDASGCRESAPVARFTHYPPADAPPAPGALPRRRDARRTKMAQTARPKSAHQPTYFFSESADAGDCEKRAYRVTPSASWSRRAERRRRKPGMYSGQIQAELPKDGRRCHSESPRMRSIAWYW